MFPLNRPFNFIYGHAIGIFCDGMSKNRSHDYELYGQNIGSSHEDLAHFETLFLVLAQSSPNHINFYQAILIPQHNGIERQHHRYSFQCLENLLHQWHIERYLR
jgi:hypothetical protein